jgi:hypothetical protein
MGAITAEVPINDAAMVSPCPRMTCWNFETIAKAIQAPS